MAYTKYSLTPSSNTAAPPDGAPEGMLPSAVNDTMRDMMAQIRDCGDGIRDGTYTMTAPKITGGTITGATFTGNTFSNPIVTGVSTFAAGTVSAPSITTTGDTNTGIFFPAADTIAFTEGGVESMRIDSSGNVGIGTTSPTFPVGTGLEVSRTGSVATIQANRSDASIAGSISIQGGSGQNNLYSAGAKPLVLYTDATERMRIDSSGSLLVGQTTAAVETGSIVTAKNLEITRTVDSDGAALGQLSWVNNTNAGAGSGTSFVKDVACIKGIMDGTGNNSGGYITFETKADAGSRAERMRITSGGALCVGTTSATGSVRFIVESDTTTLNPMTVSNTRSTASTDYSILFYRNGSIVGSVQTSLSATSYVTSSDYRLKENIAPMTGALAKVAQLKPVNYKWKSDGSDGQGFIAHELQAIVPECVIGEKDAVDEKGDIKPQGIDTSFLVATLTAAIQELKAIVDTQTTKIAELEAKL